MRRTLARALLSASILVCVTGASGTPATVTKSASIKSARKRRPAAPPVSAAARLAARTEIERRMAADTTGFENPQALERFAASLDGTRSVHIMQFGDSHTASDDWVNAMRAVAQEKYGNGGPGFIQAGHPYRGYRRFDASGANSPGWRTEGVMANRGDGANGLSGVSISTATAGQTVTLGAAGEALEIFYLQQPGGGRLELTADGKIAGAIATDGEMGPGHYQCQLSAGPHQLSLRTLDQAPVRIFGWSLDSLHGVTFETLGINGAQANVILEWNEPVWAAEMRDRDPSLVILAYGTNEANSRTWSADQYRLDLTAVIERVRQAAPGVSILMIGPPDCGRLRPLLHLAEVIAMQREIAGAQHVAFWDWRMHMGGARSIRRWVTAGLAQSDYIHMTGEGYQLIGKAIFERLEGMRKTTPYEPAR